MTARVAPVAEKTCANPLCQTTFRRKRDQSVASWQRTRFCSRACVRGPRGDRAVEVPRSAGSSKAREETWRHIDTRYLVDERRRNKAWLDVAACRFQEPEIFFPVSYSGPGEEQVERAKAICRACPALMQCARWSVEVLHDGIAGGMTPDERRAYRLGHAS